MIDKIYKQCGACGEDFIEGDVVKPVQVYSNMHVDEPYVINTYAHDKCPFPRKIKKS